MMLSVIGQPVRPLLLLLHEVNIKARKQTVNSTKINFFIVIYLVELFCILVDAKLYHPD